MVTIFGFGSAMRSDHMHMLLMYKRVARASIVVDVQTSSFTRNDYSRLETKITPFITAGYAQAACSNSTDK